MGVSDQYKIRNQRRQLAAQAINQGGQNVGYRTTSQAASGSAAHGANLANVGTPIAPTGVTIVTGRCPSPIAFEDAGIRAGEIVAYRAWQVVEGHLHSMLMSAYRWTPRAVERIEIPPSEVSPTGFYSFKELEKAFKEYGGGACSMYVGGVAFGEVLLWGTVIEHERGYRAQCCKINKLMELRGGGDYRGRWITRPWRKNKLHDLRKLYGV